MKKHVFKLKHDKGYVTITLFGHSSIESATKTICAIERCPERAIKSVKEISL
jgi:ferredoxin